MKIDAFARTAVVQCGVRNLAISEAAAPYGCIRQYSHLFGLHFQHTTSDEHEFLFCLSGHFDTNRTGFDTRNQRRVARVNTELTRFAGQHDELGLAGVDLLFGADYVYVQGVYGFSHDFTGLSGCGA